MGEVMCFIRNFLDFLSWRVISYETSKKKSNAENSKIKQELVIKTSIVNLHLFSVNFQDSNNGDDQYKKYRLVNTNSNKRKFNTLFTSLLIRIPFRSQCENYNLASLIHPEFRSA